MRNLITEATRVSGLIGVWAVPKDRYDIREEREDGNPDPFPFKYRLSTETVWSEGAVKLTEEEVQLTIPDGIDLLRSALHTLHDRKREILAEAEMRCQEINKRIQELQMITYQPQPENENFIVGETL